MPKVRFTVLGEPQGKGRPRFTKIGNYVRTYTPDETVAYENLIKLEYRRQTKDFVFAKDTPLDVRIIGYYGIPKSASKKKQQQMLKGIIRPLKKVDADNLCKVICDSLNEVAYHDDVQVVDCQIRKFYSEQPRVVVTIREATIPSEESEETK